MRLPGMSSGGSKQQLRMRPTACRHGEQAPSGAARLAARAGQQCEAGQRGRALAQAAARAPQQPEQRAQQAQAQRGPVQRVTRLLAAAHGEQRLVAALHRILAPAAGLRARNIVSYISLSVTYDNPTPPLNNSVRMGAQVHSMPAETWTGRGIKMLTR